MGILHKQPRSHSFTAPGLSLYTALLAQVDGWIREVALGICALVHAYNVPCVVLGGGIMEQAYVFEGTKELAERFLIPGFRGVRIVQASLGNMAGLYGAASLV